MGLLGLNYALTTPSHVKLSSSRRTICGPPRFVTLIYGAAQGVYAISHLALKIREHAVGRQHLYINSSWNANSGNDITPDDILRTGNTIHWMTDTGILVGLACATHLHVTPASLCGRRYPHP